MSIEQRHLNTFNSILVANRGEIAVRVIRTAKALGYRTIAVYSEADAAALHVRIADEAVLIGAAPVADSYLNGERILQAARTMGAEAIHPGYGFLSENADFASTCLNTGLTFIGPGTDAIALMGNKAQARQRMVEAGVRCVPGYDGENQSNEALLKAAQEIGFPLMVKAAAGGGGRGIRLVGKKNELVEALSAARSEALNTFASDELILEKAILRPRHVEVQVFADAHGNVVHLGERDCSVQRRHQKVVEEAPCPVMTQDLRARMGETAAEAARSIGYLGAGTVEFLLDASGEFYFLEMNTRLQVEHPVTEMITGLDLVALQIEVAQGRPLGFMQSEITLNGHAIEVRLYAEDPGQDFLPVTGSIDLWQPANGEGIRTDTGIETGLQLSPFYDPMLAKIIAWGDTRDTARRRLLRALKETALFGITSNQGFLIQILKQETFCSGEATTAFIDEEFSKDALAGAKASLTGAKIAAVLQYLIERQSAFENTLNVSAELLNWSSAGHLLTRYIYPFEDGELDIIVTPRGDDRYIVRLGDGESMLHVISFDSTSACMEINGERRHHVLYSAPLPGIVELSMDGCRSVFRNRIAFPDVTNDTASSSRVLAPMHGTVLEIFVAQSDKVSTGTRLMVLEAMKMQHIIVAETDGTVSEVCTTAGNHVVADELLIEIEPD